MGICEPDIVLQIFAGYTQVAWAIPAEGFPKTPPISTETGS